ncbi:hypothetical protein [Phascolarctobacterium sp.]|uniref:hypothetical protein n=1 Tax=Phascolarctobacterium sp. TaxID=2049039 RepID=UPI0025D74F2D|nr:hypothetical protein [Phascolarctobacterium sp.]
MTDIIEAYAENRAAKAAKDAKEAAEKAAYKKSIELAKNMLADNMNIENVVRYSGLSEEVVRALAAKQSA